MDVCSEMDTCNQISNNLRDLQVVNARLKTLSTILGTAAESQKLQLRAALLWLGVLGNLPILSAEMASPRCLR